MELNDFSTFVDTQVLNETIDNISNMPKRMEKGLSLVYPEKQESYLEFLLDKAKIGNCHYIDNALQIMQALEDGMSVEDAYKLINDPVGTYVAKVRGVVLSWSKRGPEFFKGTLPCPYEYLDQDTKQAVAMLEQENMGYAENARANQNNVGHKKIKR